MGQQFMPAEVCPPGQILLEELEARGWSQKDLANIINRPIQTINEITKGTKQITPETALQLAAAFETSPEFWLNLENNYRLYLARKEKNEQDISRRSKLYRLLPIPELIKRSWLPATQSIDELEKEVCKFLEVSSLDAYPSQGGVSFRYTPSRQPEANAQLAWVKRVQSLARQQSVANYDREKLLETIPHILSHSTKENGVAEVPELLMSLGVRFVIVPHLPKTYVDGAAMYLDDQPDQPIVALTLRHNRIDAFWFNLMHELAHIILRHQGVILDNLEEGDVNEEEREANQKARDWLLDPAAFSSFVNTTQPYFSEAKIEGFAQEQCRHPGIVLGRLQYEGLVGYQHLRGLLTSVKKRHEWGDRH